jgi:hypothetical protein
LEAVKVHNGDVQNWRSAITKVTLKFWAKKNQIPVLLDSIFFSDPNRRQKFSLSFLTRDLQVGSFQVILFLAFYSSINYII